MKEGADKNHETLKKTMSVDLGQKDEDLMALTLENGDLKKNAQEYEAKIAQ